MAEYETSIPLEKKFFELIKSGEKDIHIDKDRHGLKYGDVVRFMNGYSPKNGVVYRKIFRVSQKQVREINVYVAYHARVSLEWILDYADGKLGKWLYLFILEEAEKDG